MQIPTNQILIKVNLINKNHKTFSQATHTFEFSKQNFWKQCSSYQGLQS